MASAIILIALLSRVTFLCLLLPQRRIENTFHLDYMLGHVGVLIFSSLVFLGIAEFGLSPKAGALNALLHYIALVLLNLHTRSAITGYRNTLRLIYVVPIVAYVLLIILNSLDIYLLKDLVEVSTIFRDVTKNVSPVISSIVDPSFYEQFPHFYVDKIIFEVIMCFSVISVIVFTFGKQINNSKAIKRKALYKGWLYLYMGTEFTMLVIISLSYYNIFGLNGNPVVVVIYSYCIIFLAVYFSVNPSFLQYIPLIRKSSKVVFDQKLMDRFMVLDSLMVSEQLYLNKGLLIGSLCERIGIVQVELSKLIAFKTGKNYTQYVNSFRIQHAIAKLHEVDFIKEHSLSALGDQCGFSSNSSFYRAFRLETNMTPIKYYEEVVMIKPVVNDSFKSKVL